MDKVYLTNLLIVLVVVFGRTWGEDFANKKIINDSDRQIDNGEVASDQKGNIDPALDFGGSQEHNLISRYSDSGRKKKSKRAALIPSIGDVSIGISARKNGRLLTRSLTLEDKPKKPLTKVIKPKISSVNAAVQNNTKVLAQVGGTATLSCYTNHISDEVVTWLKREDDQLLTIGPELYANEARFSASISHSTKSWELFVRDVKLSDAGQYECQLTTHPPVTFLFTLKVMQAKAEIRGTKEVHIEEGSQLALQCIVNDSPSPPIYIFWVHNGTMVNYEKQRGIDVHLENFVSDFVISKVTPSDAGIYTCDPHLAENANVVVHVVTGEKPAAMQRGRTSVNGSAGSIVTSQFASNRQHSALVCALIFLLPSIFVQFNTYFVCCAASLNSFIVPSKTRDIVVFQNAK